MNLISLINKRNCLIALMGLFFAMAIWIGSVPYEPMEWDLADATTNVIWTDLYSQVIYEIPFEEWDYPMTQSVVVEHEGQFVVVNEKGPGLVVMLVPFHVTALEFLFGPIMAGIAMLSTYMLGMRLFGWKAGFIAAVIVLTNLSVIVMWHRYYWTDAATMHLLVFAIWLFVEANYRFNGRSLDPRSSNKPSRNNILLALAIAFFSGIIFGASISTRYPVALVIFAPLIYILFFYTIRAWPKVREKKIIDAFKRGKGLIIVVIFIIGLLCILVPLMQYNTEYFGGPFKSGYDATTLMKFNASEGVTPRDQSGNWFESFGEGIETSLQNAVTLAPILILRMPALLLVPLGIFLLRKKKLILLFLLLWILIAFYTYLSLSFVDRYANPRIYFDVVWEPRYFMPALPAVALLGALGVEFIAFNIGPRILIQIKDGKRGGFKNPTDSQGSHRKLVGVIITLLLLFVIAFPGIVPAVENFKDPGKSPPHHPKPLKAIKVNTDQLITEPGRYVQRFVLVEAALVVEEIPNGLRIRSVDAKRPGNITVRLDGWPPERIPRLNVGDEVVVQGLFTKTKDPNQPVRFFINVKWKTEDYIKLK